MNAATDVFGYLFTNGTNSGILPLAETALF